VNDLNNNSDLIIRRRKQCLVHRLLYYCYSTSVIPDHKYDQWEKQLRELVAAYPELAGQLPYASICPAKYPGSSVIYDYPDELIWDAEILLRNPLVRK
jgi:hypothetical protein